MTKYSDKIAITTGDPNGIGAEITIKALNNRNYSPDNFVIISNKKIIDYYGKFNNEYEIIEIPYKNTDIYPGVACKEGGEFSYQCLKKVCEIKPKAIVTAPVAKNALHMAGYIYNGQTEILDKFLSHDNQHAEMLFVANNFRVFLLTRHCSLKSIELTQSCIINKISDLYIFFKTKLNIPSPNFAICGFNPHAGEDGILGNEEKEIMLPAIEELRNIGISVTNPMPSDTLFIRAGQNYLNGKSPLYDCYIATYHDQGLIPIKTIAAYETVNMTIGLDIIRTSPGHGTAFDIAGKNIANEKGMISAIDAVLNI